MSHKFAIDNVATVNTNLYATYKLFYGLNDNSEFHVKMFTNQYLCLINKVH